jgi:hypothetical protein
MNQTVLKTFIRPLVRELHAYVPGEQLNIFPDLSSWLDGLE